MDEQMTREELEQKIAEVEDEIEKLKAEFEEVEEQLRAKVGNEGDSTDEGSGEGEEQVEEDEETIALREKEAELFQALTVAQARLVALKKQLNDVISNEAIAEYGQEE